MSLLNKIKTDQLRARKARKSLQIALLTTLLSEAANIGLNDGKRESTDVEVIAVIKKFIKNIDETLNIRTLDNLIIEREILEGYLPSQLSEKDLETIVCGYMLDSSAPKSMKMMGSIMKFLRETHEGEYDGKMASTIVKRMLMADTY